MRWRLSGSTWRLASGLVVLAQQVDEVWPKRHAADGTLGNLSHSSRTSDHNPDTNGIVRALDIGEVVENDAMIVAEAVRKSKDRRVKYVIHEARMYSYYWKNGVPPFTWRTYTGSNLHWNHVHFSSRRSYDSDTSPWEIGRSYSGGGEEDMKEVFARLQASLIRAGHDLGSFAPYLPAGDPDSLPGADGSWGSQSRTAQDAANRLGATGTNDSIARTQAKAAHTRLDKLHNI